MVNENLNCKVITEDGKSDMRYFYKKGDSYISLQKNLENYIGKINGKVFGIPKEIRDEIRNNPEFRQAFIEYVFFGNE